MCYTLGNRSCSTCPACSPSAALGYTGSGYGAQRHNLLSLHSLPCPPPLCPCLPFLRHCMLNNMTYITVTVCMCRLSLKDVKLYGTVRVSLLEQAEGMPITKAQLQAALSQSSIASHPSATRSRTMPHSPTRIMPPVTYSLYQN